MLLRDRRSLMNMVAAVMACVAVLVYAFSSPATHAPNLHAAGSAIADNSAAHDHGGHSHDDLDVASEDGGVTDHHHADHTHEKAGLVQAVGYFVRASRRADYEVLASSLTDGPLYGIDRPPRSVTSI